MNIFELIPKKLVKKISEQYIAGDSFKDAEDIVKHLNKENIYGVYDLLGESDKEARDNLEKYLEVIDLSKNTKSSLSVKLTNIGILKGYWKCRDNLLEIASACDKEKKQITVDMEDTKYTERTLVLIKEINEKYPVGCVLQANLKRSLIDASSLKNIHVRVCKGSYRENKNVAFRGTNILTSFARIVEKLIKNNCQVAVATHDLRLAKRWFGQDVDYQFLFGVKHVRPFINKVKHKHKTSIYVPFGDSWYAYSLRRFKENPLLAITVLKNLFRF
jgi:proline dehydrogenase